MCLTPDVSERYWASSGVTKSAKKRWNSNLGRGWYQWKSVGSVSTGWAMLCVFLPPDWPTMSYGGLFGVEGREANWAWTGSRQSEKTCNWWTTHGMMSECLPLTILHGLHCLPCASDDMGAPKPKPNRPQQNLLDHARLLTWILGIF